MIYRRHASIFVTTAKKKRLLYFLVEIKTKTTQIVIVQVKPV